MAAIWRTVLSDETRGDILGRPLIVGGTIPGARAYEVHDCGCTIILDEGAFVLCMFHAGFENGVLAVSRQKWKRRR